MPNPADRSGIPASCPMDRLLRLLWHEWTTHILWVLGNGGPIRFGELRRLVGGVSSKMLAARLRRMEADGLIYRHHEPTVPPQVIYGLTARGRELDEALRSLHGLAERWSSRGEEAGPR